MSKVNIDSRGEALLIESEIELRAKEYPFFSKDIEPKIRDASEAFASPGINGSIVNGSQIVFPEIEWSNDFEIRLIVDIKDPSTFDRLIEKFPQHFETQLLFWKSYIADLNLIFCKSFSVQYSKIRFCQISDDQCTRFHADNVLVRLFQTIKGPGTEYAFNENVNREGIGGGCNSKIIIDSSKIQYTREKDIVLMRGNKWFDSRGLVHRSPPIENRGLKRLYLCIDAIRDLSDSGY